MECGNRAPIDGNLPAGGWTRNGCVSPVDAKMHLGFGIQHHRTSVRPSGAATTWPGARISGPVVLGLKMMTETQPLVRSKAWAVKGVVLLCWPGSFTLGFFSQEIAL